MKVVLLLQDTRSLYGAEQATIRLAKGLRYAGVSVRVLLMCESRLGAGRSPLADEFSRIAPVEELTVHGRFSRTAISQIREFMAREQANVLHSAGYKADWHAGAASQWGTLFPIVSTVHGWLFRANAKERLFQALNLFALRRFTRVVVLCNFYERYLRRHGFNPLQLAHVPTGISADSIVGRTEAEASMPPSGAPFVFGMLGRLSSEKNHALLLRAAARLARDLDDSPRPWRIVMAGEGPLRAPLQRLAEKLGLADRIAWTGWMDSREFFRKVNVLVQCSRVENQPMSIMEAMAWTRPVLATQAGGMPELVRDGETGWLVPNRNSRALAKAMKRCLLSPEQSRSLGMRGRERLERDYPFNRMIEDHVGLYATLPGSNITMG